MCIMSDILEEYCSRFCNWGKWGSDDEVGTLNYISPEKVRQAAQLVRKGRAISLALPFDANGPQTGRLSRVNPIHTMLATGSDDLVGDRRFPRGFGYADDMVSMPLQCGTQWDGLSHIFRDGRMWNGYSASDVTSAGAAKNGIEKMRDRVVSRGVLLDVAAFKGVDSLVPGYAITIEDLNGAAQRGDVEVGEGDVVLVRTGFMGQRLRDGWGDYAGGDAPGLSFDSAPWIHEKRIAALATDTWGVEVRPNQLPDSFQPMHLVLVVNMGLLVGEIFALDELAADCAADGVYEFMFVAPPLPITGAVGSPLNPLAIK
ncbi:MAG: cyclase family protein [Dehalococcoidia bacterium]|nr:cyclase family protein [Dehalococcoidia bacterium]